MSRSPKYAQARLARERQREIERRRKAREEERRRQAEARRQRQEAERAQAAAAERERAAERAQARWLTDELAEVIAGVVRERAAAGLPGDPGDELASMAALLARDLRAQRHAQVFAREAEVRRVIEVRTAELDDWLDDRERVASIVDAIAQALPGLGLRVDPDSLREADDPRGMVHFRAERPDAAVQVAVVPDGRGAHDVVYELSGFDLQEHVEGDRVVHACPTAEALLEQLHAAMRSHGVETGALQWEGKPDTRPDEFAARPIPHDQGRGASE